MCDNIFALLSAAALDFRISSEARVCVSERVVRV